MSTDSINKHPEIHGQLAASVAAALVDGGMSKAEAERWAEAVKERLRRDFAGQKVYIPGTRYTVDYMRAEIGQRWNGRNTRELCRELEISESRLRQLAAPFSPDQPLKSVGT